MEMILLKRIRSLFIIPIVILLVVGTAFADTVKLKGGREISGRLKEITDKEVVLEIGPGKVWFNRDEVESINNLSVEEAQARLSTEDAFIMHNKNKAIDTSAQEGLNFVSKTRKLEFKNIPEVEIVSKDKIREYIKNNVDKHYTKEKLEAEAKLLLKLGLIAKTQDYISNILDLLTEKVAGYYNPDDKKIYVAVAALGEILPGLPSMTIMHEQVHALQDQYYDLKKWEDSLQWKNEDEALAIQSVIEGEATVLMYDAFFRSFKGFGMPDISKGEFDIRSFVIDSMLSYSKRFKTKEGKSAIFIENLLFPYVWGGSFIQWTVNTKGWPAVETIYIDMPTSSEQIMHPEKYYIVRDEPKKVKFPNVYTALDSSWVRLSKDTLGEFSFYLIGKMFLDELSSKLMSEGWGGDSFLFFEQENSKQLLLLSISTWDTERDAEDFFVFYKKIIEKKYKQLTLVKEDKNFFHYKSQQDNIYIFRSGSYIVLIEGAPDNLISGLIELLTIL